MINTIETILDTKRGIGVIRRNSLWSTMEGVEACGRLALRRRILPMIALCSTFWLVAAAAPAQILPNNDSPSAAVKARAGWWSPETAQSETTPHLVLSVAKLTSFGSSDSLRTLTIEPSSYRSVEHANSSMLEGFGLAPDTRKSAPGSLAADDLLFPSISSLLETKYTQWESSLADTRSLTNVNGISVYPLTEMNYAGWHLPVTLYISFRDSDAR